MVDESVIKYCVDLVHATRSSPQVHAGASPRGVEALVKLSRSLAVLDGRGYVTPDDVKTAALPALTHRIVLRPELWVRGVEPVSVVEDCLSTVPTPPTLPRSGDTDRPQVLGSEGDGSV
jgi:MoxR-like ATPase